MQRKQKILLGIMAAVLVSAMGVGAYADNNEKKLDKQLNSVEKKLESFESQIERAWGLHDGHRRSVTMQADGSYHVSGVKVVSVNASGNMLTVEFFGFTREVSVAGGGGGVGGGDGWGVLNEEGLFVLLFFCVVGGGGGGGGGCVGGGGKSAPPPPHAYF